MAGEFDAQACLRVEHLHVPVFDCHDRDRVRGIGVAAAVLANGGWNVDWTAPLTSRLLLEGVIYHRFINSWRTHPFGLPDVGDTIEDIVAYNVDAISKNLIGVQDRLSGTTTTASNLRNKSHDTPFRATLSYVTGAQLQVRHLQQHRPQAEHGDELRRAVWQCASTTACRT